jgi:hypothetical protein
MLIALLASMSLATPLLSLDKYDVVWDTQSIDSSGSMPIGNGEVALNAWVEKSTGDLLFYIGRTDSLSEISRGLKLGRVRMHFDPPILKAGDFRQRLHLRDGEIEFRSSAALLKLFVDSESNTVYLSGEAGTAFTASAAMECWRTQARELPKDEMVSAWSAKDAPFPLIESADVFEKMDRPVIQWYHRNETSVVPKLWAEQSLNGMRGRWDPLIHRTFGGRMEAPGFSRAGNQALVSLKPIRSFELKLTTHTQQADKLKDWQDGLDAEAAKSDLKTAEPRTERWWADFWNRSWVFVDGDRSDTSVPSNSDVIRKGIDSAGGNVFPGSISEWRWYPRSSSAGDLGRLLATPGHAESVPFEFSNGFTLAARIRPDKLTPGRIFDKLTAGRNDGFLLDTYPGDGLRLIVGDRELTAPHVLRAGVAHDIIASYDSSTGEATIYLDGVSVAHQPPEVDSIVSRGYILQRYSQACQGRGELPIKFNGGYFTVEPTAMGRPFNADWRAWGDAHWFQNVRHTVHPMLASGDFEMMEPFFHLYEKSRTLAEERSRFYHQSEGAYFPETMTPFGTYAGGDYGWDRKGLQPKDVQCPWWDDAWNQGPELVALMLDRWDYTRDERFLKDRVLPMAESVLKYFDTRFKKDKSGRIVLDPTQVVETYWDGVVNDMPATAGLIAITHRLHDLPESLVPARQRSFFDHMRASCPELPLQQGADGEELAPAQKYDPKTSNVENGQLYAVWPFRVVDLAHPRLMAEARRAYDHRLNHLDVGWGYDGNVAALLGMTDEAARILLVKCRNSNPAYRWPATWGPNFDWLPDQNHGGNLLNTTNLMLLQAEPLEDGGAIRILPAWPKKWDVSFKLHAPGNTSVACVAKSGRILSLTVDPASRLKDIVWPEGWGKP